MRYAITGAVQHASQLDVTPEEKLRVLKEDLRNGPCHVIGLHDSCKDYYCKQQTEENLVPQLKSLDASLACGTICLNILDGFCRMPKAL